MNKFNPDKVGKQTMKLCKEIADTEEYHTATQTIYQRTRGNFTTAKTVDEIVDMGYPLELVELIYKETFK